MSLSLFSLFTIFIFTLLCVQMNPAFGQNSAVVAGTNSLGGGLGEGATRQLEVAVVRAAGLGGAR